MSFLAIAKLTQTTDAMAATAPVQEIFSSIQGEGIHVGKRQIFVRFAHCHLKCAYCDTPMTSPTGQCHIEESPGTGQTSLAPNPLSANGCLSHIEGLLPQAKHHSISFTGGEPLLYHRFLAELLPQVHPQCPTYLETSGTQPDFLEPILPWVDIVAMDIKLPSATKEAPQFENHAAFYQLMQSKADLSCFIKLVFNEKTTLEEMDAVRQIVSDSNTPIILQPETSLSNRTVKVNPQQVFKLEHHLSQFFQDVRVIPQTHKMLNVL